MGPEGVGINILVREADSQATISPTTTATNVIKMSFMALILSSTDLLAHRQWLRLI